jgi:hypothetical protein
MPHHHAGPKPVTPARARFGCRAQSRSWRWQAPLGTFGDCAIKVLVPDVQPAQVELFRQIKRSLFVMARLFSGQLGERRADDRTPEGTRRWFADEVAAPGDARQLHADGNWRMTPMAACLGGRNI